MFDRTTLMSGQSTEVGMDLNVETEPLRLVHYAPHHFLQLGATGL